MSENNKNVSGITYTDVILTTLITSILTLGIANYLYTETEYLDAFSRPNNILIVNNHAIMQKIITEMPEAGPGKVNKIYKKALFKLADRGYIVINSEKVEAYPESQTINTDEFAEAMLEILRKNEK